MKYILRLLDKVLLDSLIKPSLNGFDVIDGYSHLVFIVVGVFMTYVCEDNTLLMNSHGSVSTRGVDGCGT